MAFPIHIDRISITIWRYNTLLWHRAGGKPTQDVLYGHKGGKYSLTSLWRVPVPNPIVSVTSSAWSAWDLLSFSTMSHSALRPKRTRTVGHPTSGQGYHLKWCLSALKVHTQHLWCLLKFTSGFSILGWGLSFCMSNKLSDDTSAGASLGTTLWVSGFRAYFVDC